jgi:myo-inositol 2-dehydrogenase / D-chiro-inositol 1-dehydrogenase
MDNKLGVGFIGAGSVTQAIHLPTLARLIDLFQVRQVYDVVADVAALVAQRVGARGSTSLDDLLADEAVDVVAICSPHKFHAEQVVAACRAGKRGVLCEKPLAMSRDEANRISAVSAETGVPILVGAMHTFDPGWQSAVQAWGDLPSSSFALRSSIVLPPNSRFEDVATELITRPGGTLPGELDQETQARMLHAGVMGLAIHDLPLVRSLLPHYDDVAVLAARFLRPFGYHIVLAVGGKRVELHALMSATWRPAWIFEAVSPDQLLRTEFTPSFVHAGSAVSSLRGADITRTFGPFDCNGYEVEWRVLGEIARGERAAPDPGPLIDDVRFALSLADAAADAIRRPSREEAPR